MKGKALLAECIVEVLRGKLVKNPNEILVLASGNSVRWSQAVEYREWLTRQEFYLSEDEQFSVGVKALQYFFRKKDSTEFDSGSFFAFAKPIIGADAKMVLEAILADAFADNKPASAPTSAGCSMDGAFDDVAG